MHRKNYDGNAAALRQILDTWDANTTYAARIAALQAANFTYRLVAGQTVFDDNAADQLTGAAGSDWFFANVTGSGAADTTDAVKNETTSDT